jgi:hypothetical protein
VGARLVGGRVDVAVARLTLGTSVAVSAGLIPLGVSVGLKKPCVDGAIAILKSARVKKNSKKVVILRDRVIVPKFTKKGDGVSPQYNTAERGYFLSNFNLSSIMPAVIASSLIKKVKVEKFPIISPHLCKLFVPGISNQPGTFAA